MKRVAILFAVFLGFATISEAADVHVHVLIPNFGSYGKGMVCVVDQQYNGQFAGLIHAPSLSTDRTSRSTALKLLYFFRDVDKNACYQPQGTSQWVPVPSTKPVYVVSVVMTQDGSRVYWNVTDLDASSGVEQYVTVDAPALR